MENTGFIYFAYDSSSNTFSALSSITRVSLVSASPKTLANKVAGEAPLGIVIKNYATSKVDEFKIFKEELRRLQNENPRNKNIE